MCRAKKKIIKKGRHKLFIRVQDVGFEKSSELKHNLQNMSGCRWNIFNLKPTETRWLDVIKETFIKHRHVSQRVYPPLAVLSQCTSGLSEAALVCASHVFTVMLLRISQRSSGFFFFWKLDAWLCDSNVRQKLGLSMNTLIDSHLLSIRGHYPGWWWYLAIIA